MEISWVTTIVLLAGAYLLGSVPFGLLLGKMVGVDVRREGSGNIGATNVGRLLGKKLGVATLAADMLKGVVPMLLAGRLLAGRGEEEALVVALCGLAAFLGHLFPVYLRFQGGKGVATALGVFLYLSPLAAVGAIAVFMLVLLNWGYVSLASLSAAFFMPALIWLFYGGAGSGGEYGQRVGPAAAGDGGEAGVFGILDAVWATVWLDCLLALLFAALIWFKHRDNIARLLRGEEKSWRKPAN